jgi:hypothetical protein
LDLILSPLHNPLRVHCLLPALPRLFSRGRAARDEIEWVRWLVQSILGPRSSLRRAAGSWFYDCSWLYASSSREGAARELFSPSSCSDGRS